MTSSLNIGPSPEVWNVNKRPEVESRNQIISEVLEDDNEQRIIEIARSLKIQKLKRSVKDIKSTDKYKKEELDKLAKQMGIVSGSDRKDILVKKLLEVIGRFRDLDVLDDDEIIFELKDPKKLLNPITLKRLGLENTIRGYTHQELGQIANRRGMTSNGTADYLRERLANSYYYEKFRYNNEIYLDKFVTKGLVKRILINREINEFYKYLKCPVNKPTECLHYNVGFPDNRMNNSLKTISATLKFIFPKLDRQSFIGTEKITNERHGEILSNLILNELDSIGFNNPRVKDWPNGEDNYVSPLKSIELDTKRLKELKDF